MRVSENGRGAHLSANGHDQEKSGTYASGGERVVSERALIQRINRRLARDIQKLHKSRPWQVDEFGLFYTVEFYSPNVTSNGNLKASWSTSGTTGLWIDLEQLGREVGALADCEALGDR